jgi:uncharacterized protein
MACYTGSGTLRHALSAGIAAIMLTVTLLPATRAASAAEAQALLAPHIETTGQWHVEVPADLALLDFGVVTRAPTAEVAARQNRERMDAVLTAVRKAAGLSAQIRTGNYSLRPEYSSQRDGAPPRVTGYAATNVVQLRTSELQRVGQVIDVAITAGANQVQRLSFTLADQAAAHRDALREAVLRARAKAEAIAAAAGVKLGTVRSVVEQDAGDVRPLMREAMMARSDAAPTTPVEPGLIEVSARVVLTINAGQ